MYLFFMLWLLIELIILASGDKIAPVPIESAIKEELHIVSNVILVGDQRKFLSCLISFKVIIDSKVDSMNE